MVEYEVPILRESRTGGKTMSIDTILEVIFDWKYVWWIILVCYIFVSEGLYFIMCKFNLGEDVDGGEMNWIGKKFMSFAFGIMITMLIGCIIILGIGLTVSIIDDPMGCLKIAGIIISVIVGIFVFFFANYKIWERFN